MEKITSASSAQCFLMPGFLGDENVQLPLLRIPSSVTALPGCPARSLNRRVSHPALYQRPGRHRTAGEIEAIHHRLTKKNRFDLLRICPRCHGLVCAMPSPLGQPAEIPHHRPDALLVSSAAAIPQLKTPSL
jgi:hypothetical protein